LKHEAEIVPEWEIAINIRNKVTVGSTTIIPSITE